MMSAAGFQKLHPDGSEKPLRILGREGTRMIWATANSLVEGFAAGRRKELKWEGCRGDESNEK